MRKYWWIIIALVAVAAAAVLLGSKKPATRWFDDQAYNYQTLRTLGEGIYGGSDAGEVLTAIRDIREGDDESWFVGWRNEAVRTAARAQGVENRISRGRAFLRAANYYRTAEFFLDPRDVRRKKVFHDGVSLFERGLKDLGVEHEIWLTPYGQGELKAVYYQGREGAEDKPLLLVHGGYDSTQEEIYFVAVAAALERGYSCLTFAGPGQGAALRDHNLKFTPEWEKPTRAIIDLLIEKKGRPKTIVLMGLSLGGYLAPRAAAYDKRIDGVVAHNVCFELKDAAFQQMPGWVKALYAGGFTGLVDNLITLKMKFDPGLRWGVRNAQWTMGAKGPGDVIEMFDRYNLREESADITCDVLVTVGEKDHFFPKEQADDFKRALVNARSVTIRIFPEKEGGAEHCQMGALNMFHEALFDWIRDRFETTRPLALNRVPAGPACACGA